ncbi:unnamed protein product [Fusarium graminearum]|nr:unnamed protein product [Fusarium graminearum]
MPTQSFQHQFVKLADYVRSRASLAERLAESVKWPQIWKHQSTHFELLTLRRKSSSLLLDHLC